MHAKPSNAPQAAGLTRAEALRRLKAHGPNTLVKKKRVHPIALFFQQFADFLTIILLMSTGLSLVLGEHTEAVTILAIVILNALLGFLQEYRTEKTIEALKGLAAPRARAVRDGRLEEIPAADLVPGDRIVLEQGDRIPADATLLEGFGLRVDESLLTGESVPVEKSLNGPQEARSLYMGTLITQGRAAALVTATGMETQMGRIAGMLGEIEEPKTPFTGPAGPTRKVHCRRLPGHLRHRVRDRHFAGGEHPGHGGHGYFVVRGRGARRSFRHCDHCAGSGRGPHGASQGAGP